MCLLFSTTFPKLVQGILEWRGRARFVDSAPFGLAARRTHDILIIVVRAHARSGIDCFVE